MLEKKAEGGEQEITFFWGVLNGAGEGGEVGVSTWGRVFCAQLMFVLPWHFLTRSGLYKRWEEPWWEPVVSPFGPHLGHIEDVTFPAARAQEVAQ